MNNGLTTIAIFQLIIALFLGIGVMYFTFNILYNRIVKKYDLGKDNVAFAVFAAGTLFAFAYLMSGITSPILSTVKVLDSSGLKGAELLVECGKYTGIFVFIGFSISGIINVASVFLFTTMTRGLDEFKELQENNLAVGIITASVIIGISMIVKDSTVMLIESFIPYPNVGNINL